jgi:hypothetical protein
MSSDYVRVQIVGLREFRAGLRAMDRNLPKRISAAGKRAGRIVVDTARPRVPRGPAKGGHAASSIKARATQKGVSVIEGGNRWPYMAWIDFGGPIHPRPGQEIRRPYFRKGRFIWAAFADRREEVMATYLDALADAAREAGVDVS